MTVGSTRPRLTEAYAECARITREEARNFHYGIRLLPPEKRAALSVVYAFARRADDIGDDPAIAPAQKSVQLAHLRKQLESMSPDSGDPVMVALDDVSKRYPLPLEALSEMIDGIEMDVHGTTYETFDELVIYCRRVAGTAGRLCLAIFGCAPHPDAPQLADRLGIALQQTNILRDIREDLINGRVYIPAQDLDRFGVTLKLDANGELESQAGGFEELVRAGTARAEEWYAQGLRLLDILDRRSFACCAAMSGIYHRLNASIASQPGLVRGQRVSLSGREKAGVAVRSLAGVRP